MKASTLEKRLQKKYTGSKSKKSYRIILDLIKGTNETGLVEGNIIRPVYRYFNYKMTKNVDHTQDTKNLLDLLGLKYEFGNDAPRGGLTGNYFKIKTKIVRDF